MLASARGRQWEPVRERKTVGASEREEDRGSQRERKTMGASARGRPWETVRERKTMGDSEREEDHGSQ